MALDDYVPHPGPTPPVFGFPFAQARALLDALVDLEAGLDTLLTTHDDAWASAQLGFSGRTRDRFESDFTARMDALDGARTTVRADVAAMEAAIADAHRLQAENEAARAAHARQLDAHEAWRRAAAAAIAGGRR